MTDYRTPFITIEGVDGAGKSSHIPTIVSRLEAAGFSVVSTREPGGTPLGEMLRKEILNTSMALSTEVLLAFASRAEHLDKVIRPALTRGDAVVCDRFTDSTYAFQGSASGYPMASILTMETLVQEGLTPDLTLLFDLTVEQAEARLGNTGKIPDKFEGQPSDYHQRVRNGYLARVAADPQRFAVIDSSPSLPEVSAQVCQAVDAFIERYRQRLSRRPKI